MLMVVVVMVMTVVVVMLVDQGNLVNGAGAFDPHPNPLPARERGYLTVMVITIVVDQRPSFLPFLLSGALAPLGRRLG
jgi:hypothetical protein